MGVRRSLKAVALGTFVSVAGCTPLGSTDPPYLSGMVETAGGQPVAGALVRIQGTNITTWSGDDGRYWLPQQPTTTSRHITAWKDGYYNGGALLDDASPSIQLRPWPETDDANYRWLPARAASRSVGPDELGKPCETCHFGGSLPIVREWEQSAHARSAINSFFLSFYNGAGGIPLRPALGYRRDFPGSTGNCANCHVPALALSRPYDADPNQATGVEREGVVCDLCHKIRQVEVDQAGGRAGVLSMAFARPGRGKQMFFGPFDDVFPGDDSFHPLYKDSRYCAACHHGLFWGVLAYSEFAEWQQSKFAEQGIHCQDCHMKPDGNTSQFAVASEGGIIRQPGTIPSHAFPGRDDLALMRSGVEVQSSAQLAGDRVRVRVSLRNTGAGHHVPTGNPMRNLVLLVEADDETGRALSLIEGGRVPAWGGEGPEELGNYAGLPGKGYAKVLVTPEAYPADPRFNDGRAPIYPAPHWRRIRIESDNRLPAGGSDETEYVFAMPANVATAQTHVRLLHRRTYRSWLDPQRPFDGDLVLADRMQSVQR